MYSLDLGKWHTTKKNLFVLDQLFLFQKIEGTSHEKH